MAVLTADEDSYLTYSFKPNLAYLDPAFEKKFIGILQVDGRTLLAQKITAQSEDGDIQFEFSISAINRAKKINLPFDENFQVTYSIEENGSRTRTVMSKRYEEMGRETRIKSSGGMLEVILALPTENQVAQTLGEQGELVVLGMNLEGEGTRIHTRGKVTDVFYVRDTVAFPTVKSLEVSFDPLSTNRVRPGGWDCRRIPSIQAGRSDALLWVMTTRVTIGRFPSDPCRALPP